MTTMLHRAMFLASDDRARARALRQLRRDFDDVAAFPINVFEAKMTSWPKSAMNSQQAGKILKYYHDDRHIELMTLHEGFTQAYVTYSWL